MKDTFHRLPHFWATELRLHRPDSVTALVRHGNSVLSFEGLVFDEMHRWEHGCALKLVNQADTLFVAVGIDLRNHKLIYEPQGNCGTKLNKKSRSSIELHQKLQEFNWLYYGNGRLELWDAENDSLLGVSDVYIPMNMYQDPEAMEKIKVELRQLLEAATED